MTPFQKWLDKGTAPRQVFAIVSWGAAATRWLAEVLNSCPGLVCVHAQNFYWKKFGGARVDGLRYLQILGMQSPGASAVGDVHGITRFEIPAIREFFGDKFRAAVIIRDPLPRLHSALTVLERWGNPADYNTNYLNALYPEAMRLLPTGNYDERLFVHGVNMLNTIVDEVSVGPVFRMEDLTRDSAVLVRLVGHISAGQVAPALAWADAQVKTEPVNRHNQARVFASWQQLAMRATIKLEAVQLYRDFGYDMSWLDV